MGRVLASSASEEFSSLKHDFSLVVGLSMANHKLYICWPLIFYLLAKSKNQGQMFKGLLLLFHNQPEDTDVTFS